MVWEIIYFHVTISFKFEIRKGDKLAEIRWIDTYLHNLSITISIWSIHVEYFIWLIINVLKAVWAQKLQCFHGVDGAVVLSENHSLDQH